MNLLIVDDDPVSRTAVKRYVTIALKHSADEAENGADAFEKCKRTQYDVVVTDIRMPELSGIEFLKKLNQSDIDVIPKVILMTGFADLETAMEAIREGAVDYLNKPVEPDELSRTLRKIEEELAEDEDDIIIAEESESYNYTQQNVIDIPDYGEIGIFTDEMKSILNEVYRYHNEKDIPVLIEGDTGTGKEGIAKLIHHGKENSDAPFIAVNCSAISSTLFESELFGYEKGSFTGAKRAGKVGYLERAQGGTLFLDEVGDLPRNMQPKLLRVLQEKEMYRVGGSKKIELNVRFIAATNLNLEELVSLDQFRRDLYFRLNLGRIHLPNFKETPDAIPPSAYLFMNNISAQKNKSFRYIDSEAMAILKKHDWTGNYRELKNAIERVVLLNDEEKMKPEHLDFLPGRAESNGATKSRSTKIDDIKLPSDEFNLKNFEKSIIKKAYKMFEGNKSKTAAYLGISRNTLQKRLKELNLE